MLCNGHQPIRANRRRDNLSRFRDKLGRNRVSLTPSGARESTRGASIPDGKARPHCPPALAKPGSFFLKHAEILDTRRKTGLFSAPRLTQRTRSSIG